ncbi:MAG: amino acid ABC transporter substrate-binding protein [Firmicutes bacterium]|nr:amino acid ABC transporter substrate-binding protein [Bacillota bacterium]
MKINSRIVAGIVAGVMAFAMAGCSSKETNDSSGADNSNSVSSDSTSGSEKKEKLIMATNAAFPPYEFYDNNQIVGIDAEIAAALAEKMGMELSIEDMEFGSIITAVQSGKANMGMAGMTVTEDRLVSVDFTDSYAEGYQVIIVKEGSPIQQADDLADKTVGVQENTTGDIYITDDYPDATVLRYSKGTEAVLALSQDKIDAVVIDREPAKAFVEANEGLVILPTEYVIEQYAIAVAKGNDEFREELNAALKELIDDGTVQGIIDKYITAE